MRGFVRGILWGSVAAASGLVAVSQIGGPVAVPVSDSTARVSVPVQDGVPKVIPGAPDVPDAISPTATGIEAAPAEAADPAPQIVVADVPETVADVPETPEATTTPSAAPILPGVADAPAGPSGLAAPAEPRADSPAAAVQAPSEPPVAPPSTAPAEERSSAGQVDPPVAPAPGTERPSAADQPAAPGLPVTELAPQPADLPPAPVQQGEALLLPLPDPEPSVAEVAPSADPTPEPVAPPGPDTGMAGDARAASTLPPAPEPGNQTPGVVTNRLPRIGVDPIPAAEAGVPLVTDLAPDDSLPPLLRFARLFDNPAQKPLFAILLQDDGQAGVNRADLAALDLPLSIVIDPLSEGAAARAEVWRAGGQEVVMAATGIPAGASPGDLEQSLQVLASRLPEAVAVIDADGRAFQNNLPLASQIVPILAGQGRGLLTLDQGLNAADQLARREGVGSAMIFRRIDADAEDSPVIRRYLDRAAFKAAQDGRVLVIGALRPETVAAILEWAVEGRASMVALAPVSALLTN
ncbi:MAG: divergent polysaccharide deacetylase family protein [Paracoccaceae bacterium]